MLFQNFDIVSPQRWTRGEGPREEIKVQLNYRSIMKTNNYGPAVVLKPVIASRKSSAAECLNNLVAIFEFMLNLLLVNCCNVPLDVAAKSELSGMS